MNTDNINFEKVLFEGWTVSNVIDEIEPAMDLLMDYHNINYESYWRPMARNKAELKKLIADETPYKKKAFPDVVKYFSRKYNII